MRPWPPRLRVRPPRLKNTLVVTAAVLATALLVGLALLYGTLVAGLPSVDGLEGYAPAETSRIFSHDGKLVAALYDENRTYVPLGRISPWVVRALTATEDARFFEHHGVDLVGLARAAFQNLTRGEIEQGASTLTMQLTRALFLTDERTAWRKLQEAVLARRIESRHSKQQILELYLNQVYFGAGAYGVQAAASRYFGRQPRDLTPAQAAMLVGLLQAPSELDPFERPQAARRRQLMVLRRMRETGALRGAPYARAVAQAREMRFASAGRPQDRTLLKYPYFTTYAIRAVSRRYSEKLLRRGGLRIRTSLDLRAQRIAERVLEEALRREGPAVNADTGAIVLLDNATGHVRAMAGGAGYGPRDRFNRAWQARRQPGSAFKPILYAAALEVGFSPESDVPDERVVFFPGTPDRWEPRNADGTFLGHVPLRTALMYSRNVVSVRLLNEIGFEPVLDLAGRMGFQGPLPGYLSLALGSGEVSPLEMAQAFAVFPSGGLHRPASPVLVIEDSQGRVLLDERSPAEDRVVSADTAAAMVEMLRRVVTRGTGTGAWIDGHPVAGKTGTTDDFRDAWFVGFTPRYTAAVWVGNDDNSPTAGIYGGTLPASIWRTFMSEVLQGEAPEPDYAGLPFEEPRTVRLCARSHFLAGPACRDTYEDVFRTVYQPTQTCPVHRLPPPTLRRISVQAWPLAPPEKRPPLPVLEEEVASEEPSFAPPEDQVTRIHVERNPPEAEPWSPPPEDEEAWSEPVGDEGGWSQPPEEEEEPWTQPAEDDGWVRIEGTAPAPPAPLFQVQEDGRPEPVPTAAGDVEGASALEAADRR